MIKRRNNNKTRTALAPPLEGETGRGLSGTVEAELAHFKKSPAYLLTMFIAGVSFFVGLGVLIDFYYDNDVRQIETQYVTTPQYNGTIDLEFALSVLKEKQDEDSKRIVEKLETGDFEVVVSDEQFIESLFTKKTFHIDERFIPLLRKSQYITIHTTRWLEQPKYLTADNMGGVRIYHASIYNDGIILWAFLLFFGLRMFFPFRSKLAELLIVRYYVLFILPFINIFFLFGR